MCENGAECCLLPQYLLTYEPVTVEAARSLCADIDYTDAASPNCKEYWLQLEGEGKDGGYHMRCQQGDDGRHGDAWWRRHDRLKSDGEKVGSCSFQTGEGVLNNLNYYVMTV